jgi:hypothetical protein
VASSSAKVCDEALQNGQAAAALALDIPNHAKTASTSADIHTLASRRMIASLARKLDSELDRCIQYTVSPKFYALRRRPTTYYRPHGLKAFPSFGWNAARYCDLGGSPAKMRLFLIYFGAKADVGARLG